MATCSTVSCSACRSTGFAPFSATSSLLRLGREAELDLDSLLPGFVLASFSHSAPASEIPTRSSALADPEVVDGRDAGFVYNLDPTMPGLYNCMFSALASNFY